MTKCVNENCDYFKEHGECSSVCENNGFTKIFTNYDRIRNMSVEELASKIVEIIDCKMCPIKNTCETWESCEHQITKWLEQEVEE